MKSIWSHAYERAINEGVTPDRAASIAERAVKKWTAECMKEKR